MSGEGIEQGAIAVAWSKQSPFGAEYAEVSFGCESLSPDGVAIGSDPLTYRLDYTLRTAAGFVTTEVEVARGDGWERRSSLVRSAVAGRPQATSRDEASLPPPGGDTEGLDTAVDPDLGLSPLFISLSCWARSFEISAPPLGASWPVDRGNASMLGGALASTAHRELGRAAPSCRTS